MLGTLGELSQLVQYGLTARAHDDVDGVLYLRISDIDDDGIAHLTSPKYVHIDDDTLQKYVLEPNDVVIARSGTVGRAFVYRESDQPWVFASYFIRFRLDESLVDPDYFGCFTRSPYYRHYIEAMARSVAQPNINSRELARLEIPLPLVSEQRRIADILHQADNLRHLRREAGAQLRDLQAALFYEMFGDPTSDSHIWEVRQVEDLAQKDRPVVRTGPFGSSLKKDEYTTRGIPVWGINNVQTNEFVEEGSLYISEDKFRQLENYVVESGDILIARAGTTGRMCVARPTQKPSIIGTNLIRLSLDKRRIVPEYFSTMFTCFLSRTINRLRAGAEGGYSFINSQSLKSLRIPVPPIELQVMFSERLNNARQLEQQQGVLSRRLDTLFESLLVRAFTGELTAGWREQNAELLQEEAGQRDMALGLQPRRRVVDTAAELETLEGKEAFDQQIQGILQLAAEQLVKAVTPTVRLDAILEIKPLMDLEEMVSALLPAHQTTINASLMRGMVRLADAVQAVLAENARSVQALAPRVVEENHQRILALAGQLAQMAALITRRFEQEHRRFQSLRALSDEQFGVYLATLQRDGYFTAANLLDEEDFPEDRVRRALVLLATLGLVARASVPTAPTGAATFYVPVYRVPMLEDDSRDDDLEAIEAAFPGLAA
jgi:type I restriction enzyme S subunit